MSAPERADDEREAVETTGVRPDESGTRLRTHGAVIEDDGEEEELELVEVVVAPRRRAAAIPPPLPRRAHHPERFDLDELLRDVARSSALGPPVVPPLDLDPATAPGSVERARSRPQHGIAMVVGTTSLVAGAIIAFVWVAPMSAEPAAAPEEITEPAIVPPEIVEAVTPAPAPSEPLEIPPPVVIEPDPPEQPEAEAAPLERRPRVRRSAAVAASDQAEATATEEAASTAATEEAASTAATEEAASEAAETAAEAVATEESAEATEASASALPERPAREEVDAAVDRIMPALRACGQGMDLITLELHFASSGRATTATTHARHLTPEQRSCVARAARTARVPPFSAPHLSVHYPVRL